MKEKWLITGASGLLGHSLCQYLNESGRHVIGISHSHTIDVENVQMLTEDLTVVDKILSIIDIHKPNVIVHAAGYTNVDTCEKNEELANILHSGVASVIAKATNIIGVKMVFISTDHLWDGTQSMITENTPTKPINAYARTKEAGEQSTLAGNPNSLIIRTNFYGPGRPWRLSFSDWIIGELSKGNKIKAFTDSHYTPICLSRLCQYIIELVEKNAVGIFNVAGSERVSKYEFAVRLANALQLDESLVEKGSISDAGLAAPRPSDMSLSTHKVSSFLGHPMPGIDECFSELKPYSN